MSGPNKEEYVKQKAASANPDEIGRLVRKMYPGEVIHIGDNVEIGLLEITSSTLRIYIRAPKCVPILVDTSRSKKPSDEGQGGVGRRGERG